ncbi:GHKL domain-containing protein [Lachnospiraceae bacterium 45-W7]
MTMPMGDLIYEILDTAEMILEHFTTACFLGYLCGRLPERKCGGDADRKQRYLAAVFYFAVMMTLHLIPLLNPSSATYLLFSFGAYLLGSAAAFLALVFACGTDFYWSLFLTVTFFSMRWQGMSITGRISVELFDVAIKFLNWLTEGQFALVWQWNMVHIGVNRALNIFLDVLMFLLFTKWFTARFSMRNRKLSGKEKLFLLTPGLSGSVIFFLVHWLIDKYELADDKGIFQEYPYFKIMIICMNLLVILSTLVVLNLFSDLEEKREEEKRQAVQQGQMQKLREHVQEMERVYGGIQGMKHDVKNHIAVLEELIAQKRFSEAREYLEPMGRAVESLDYVYKTGNPVTDVIIQEKYKRAGDLGFSFESDFQFPVQSKIDVFDMSVILNNALENALEAAETAEHGYIRVSSCWQKKMFLIEVVNYFAGTLEYDKESGMPKTTKADGGFHGTGLKNIQRVAEKYCGAIDVEVCNQEFHLMVLLSGVQSCEQKLTDEN